MTPGGHVAPISPPNGEMGTPVCGRFAGWRDPASFSTGRRRRCDSPSREPRIREGTQFATAAGTDRSVFAGAECLLVTTAAAAVAAWAISHDAVSGPIGKAGIGEGLAVAATTGADRLIFPGAELRLRPWWARARTRPLVHHHGAGRQKCRQEQESKTVSREQCRKKFHEYLPAHAPEPEVRKASCAKSESQSPVTTQNTPADPRHSPAKCNPRLSEVANAWSVVRGAPGTMALALDHARTGSGR